MLFQHLKTQGFEVSAVERYGHDPKYPVTSNWPHLVKQLADFAGPEVQRLGQRVFLVGHSLGGFLSVMAAARHPELVRGVLLIDSPLIVGGWKANVVGVAKRTQVVGSISPDRVSRQRRFSWASNEEALEHFRKKKGVCRWHPGGVARLHHPWPAGTRTANACWVSTARWKRPSTTPAHNLAGC